MKETDHTEDTTLDPNPASAFPHDDVHDKNDVDPLLWARQYHERGYSVIPVNRESKKPIGNWKGSQATRLSADALTESFQKHPKANVGVVTGDASGGLVDIDLDSREACVLARNFLPPTDMIHGRRGKALSHRWYNASPIPKSRSYAHPDGRMIVELRAAGRQTVVPGSVHTSGDLVEWHSFGSPASVTDTDLERSVRELAACAMVAMSWPKPNGPCSRHKGALALAGLLIRGGKSEQFAINFVVSAASAANDEELEDRERAVRDTSKQIQANSPVSGYTDLVEVLGEDVVRRLRDLLDLRSETETSESKEKTQADTLLRLTEQVELFHTKDEIAYASYNDGGQRTMQIEDQRFQRWLQGLYYKSTRSVLNDENLKKACAVLQARALFDGKKEKIFLRVGEHEGKFYYDLADGTGRVVEITEKGWETKPCSPIKFVRPPGMEAAPEPIRGGSINELRQFLNVTDESFILIVGFLVFALCPRGPFPVAVFKGEFGSAKSFSSRIVRTVIDPSSCPLIAMPKGEEDLCIQANNSWVLNFDNLSALSLDKSNSLCRVSTGGGMRKRMLYSNLGEILIDVRRPQVINGIDNIAWKPDLLDRCLLLETPRIRPKDRKSEWDLDSAFALAHGRILGALFDAVSGALARLHAVNVPNPPRLIDFARFATAAEKSIGWEDGAFMRAYSTTKDESHYTVLEDSSVAEAIRALVSKVPLPWEGTSGELWKELNKHKATFRDTSWPDSSKKLYGELERIKPNLRAIGIEVARLPRTSGRRPYRISAIASESVSELVTDVIDVIPNPSMESSIENSQETLLSDEVGTHDEPSDMASESESLAVTQIMHRAASLYDSANLSEAQTASLLKAQLQN